MLADSAEDVRRAAIEHHDEVVSIFEAYYRRMGHDRFANAFAYGRHKIDLLLERELNRLPRGAHVLDVGCGTGEYLRRFAEKGFVPVGVEPAPQMLESARRANPSIRIESGVATSLPFDDGSFDAVASIEVLRYLHRDDIRRALVEMVRVLRPGGMLFITLVNRFALDGFYILQRIRQRRRGVEYDRKNPHCEFFTPAEAEQELRRAGAVNVRTDGRLFAPFRILYKANAGLASRLTARLEPIDDVLHARWRWMRPLAGHLIAIGERPSTAEEH